MKKQTSKQTDFFSKFLLEIKPEIKPFTSCPKYCVEPTEAHGSLNSKIQSVHLTLECTNGPFRVELTLTKVDFYCVVMSEEGLTSGSVSSLVSLSASDTDNCFRLELFE